MVVSRRKRGSVILVRSKFYCVVVREIDVPWDPEKGA